MRGKIAFTLMIFVLLSVFAEPLWAFDKDEINSIIKDRVETGLSVGIVIATIDETGITYYCKGRKYSDRIDLVDENTLFEIGSVTKVFTASLLANMVLKQEVSLDSPVQEFLPKEVKVSEKDGSTMTLGQLGIHYSGLPRMPGNLNPSDNENPFKDYSIENLYEAIRTFQPERKYGSKYLYSNLGYAVLGQALSLKAGKDYEALLQERICGPLGLKNTVIHIDKERAKNLAFGYANGKRVKNWDLPALSGAGALRSCAQDLARLLEAQLGLLKDLEPAKALVFTTANDYATDAEHERVALGWHCHTKGPKIYWQNGGTGGYWNFLGYCPEKKCGVVIMTNTPITVDDIGFHLLNPEFPLTAGPRQELPLDSKKALDYVGNYRLMQNVLVKIKMEKEKLSVEADGWGKHEIFSDGDDSFFLKSANVQIKFERDDKGKVLRLVLKQMGKNVPAAKVE